MDGRVLKCGPGGLALKSVTCQFVNQQKTKHTRRSVQQEGPEILAMYLRFQALVKVHAMPMYWVL